MSKTIFNNESFCNFLDEFKSKEQERDFRDWTFVDDSRLSSGALIIAITALMTFSTMDLIFTIPTRIFDSFIIIRLAVLLICLLMFFLLHRTTEFKKLDIINFVGLVCVTNMVLLSNLNRPHDYFTHGGMDVAVIFLCYFANMGAIKYRLAVGLFFSTGLLMTLLFVKQPSYEITYMSYTSSVVISNVFAYIIAIMLGRTKRLNFLSLLNEKKLREEIKSLEGIIPICSYCKNIRDDEGSWEQMEAYIHEHSNAKFSHGICPDCYSNLKNDQP